MSNYRLGPEGFPTDDLLIPLLNSLPDMIHSVDKEGKIVFTNQRASEILGYSQEELLNLSIFELYAPEVRTRVMRGFTALKEKGDMKVREGLLKSKAGERIPVEIRSFGVYDENGEFMRTFTLLRDIREVKEMRDKLMHAERIGGIGQLAACVVHDIHNPLMVIQLYTEMLVQDAERYVKKEFSGEVNEYLEQMQRATHKMEKLLKHLRNFSRRETENKESVELNNLLDDALFMVMNKIVNFKVKLDRSNQEQEYPFSGSLIQLEQAFMNIFSNACDAMQGAKNKILTISISEKELDGHCFMECQIQDTGCGISNENINTIFTPFFTTKKQGEGTGLGLAISQEIIERHEGKIEVESESGKGTTFKVLLPKEF